MKSGMLAAETIFEALRKGDTSARAARRATSDGVRESWAGDELWAVRNFHQAFEHGLFAGMLQAGSAWSRGGRGFGAAATGSTTDAGPRAHAQRSTSVRRQAPAPPAPVPIDGKLTFDKLADVYNSGTAHEEDQPVHLLVARHRHLHRPLHARVRQPLPALLPGRRLRDGRRPARARPASACRSTPRNCVHCKTCDIMDPYQIITWVPPEGGGGPNYGKM